MGKKVSKSDPKATKTSALQKPKACPKPMPVLKKSNDNKAIASPSKKSSLEVETPKKSGKARTVIASTPPRNSREQGRTSDDSGNGALRTKSKQSAPVEPAAAPVEPPRKVETYLNEKQLDEFRELLLEKRRMLTGDVERLADQALNRKEHGFNEQSTMPIHMADLGSDTWEQDFTLGLLASEQGVVREIDEALRRIEDRTYGMCLATDAKIAIARLRAKPWARYCIEYERAREEGRTS